ncbi:MAG: GNAT family N-acetyltransferase [Dehalococcoidales bacterium]
MESIDKNTIKIRRLASNDITSTLGIWWADIPEKEKVASQVQGLLDLSFIAEYEGTLVGFILARLIYSSLPMKGTGLAFLIAVHPEFRRKGIAAMLVETLEKHCKSLGIDTIRVVIPAQDAKNIEYFTKAGFRKSDMINYDKVCSS